MKVINHTDSSIDAIHEAWDALTEHWRLLLANLPFEVQVYSPPGVRGLYAANRSNWVWTHKGLLAGVLRTKASYQIVCSDPFDRNAKYVGNKSANRRLQENFLGACAAALNQRYEWIADWLGTNLDHSYRGAFYPHRFMLEVFPAFHVNRRWLGHKHPRRYDLMCGLDAHVCMKMTPVKV